MRIAIGILLVIVATLLWRLALEITTNDRQREQIKELTSQVADKSRLENLELQQKCAQQAEKVFQSDKRGGLDGYGSHYNPKLGKCFMALETRGLTPPFMTFKFLFDAYENRSYAEYMWKPKNGKKYWEVPPFHCKLIPSSGEEQICKSEQEYNEFVAHYME